MEINQPYQEEYEALNVDQTTPQTTVGRFTFPALTVDTNSLFVDSVNHRVGIGTTNPTAGKLQVVGAFTGSGTAPLVVQNTNAYASPYTQYSQVWLDSSSAPMGWVRNDGSFYLNGQMKPNLVQLNVAGSAASPAIVQKHNTGLFFPATDGIAFSNAGVESMRILNGGNVGIGTTSPTATLHLKAGTATAGTAPLKLTSGTNLTTPEAGAVEYDGNNIFSTSNSLLRKTIPGVVFTQIADKTIGNTTTETTMFSTGVGSLTIPANSLVAGRTYRIKLKGYASGTNGDTSTLKVKLGSTELVSSTGTWQTLTDIGFTLDFDFTCRTTGATGTVAGNGYSLVSGGQGFSTVSMRALLAGTDTLNTTIDQVIDLTYQWSSASAGNTVTITNASIEVLN